MSSSSSYGGQSGTASDSLTSTSSSNGRSGTCSASDSATVSTSASSTGEYSRDGEGEGLFLNSGEDSPYFVGKFDLETRANTTVNAESPAPWWLASDDDALVLAAGDGRPNRSGSAHRRKSRAHKGSLKESKTRRRRKGSLPPERPKMTAQTLPVEELNKTWVASLKKEKRTLKKSLKAHLNKRKTSFSPKPVDITAELVKLRRSGADPVDPMDVARTTPVPPPAIRSPAPRSRSRSRSRTRTRLHFSSSSSSDATSTSSSAVSDSSSERLPLVEATNLDSLPRRSRSRSRSHSRSRSRSGSRSRSVKGKNERQAAREKKAAAAAARLERKRARARRRRERNAPKDRARAVARRARRLGHV
ncbi:uncharacterized protein AMSG_08226 [Thecamonas trahens ATCC 50062]|uniref:Uncharacterized protein n=1 Tax=Thecamonas trahens ATCC 50062 TaxID=461836 RepID=A0A0L0DIN9_THETB|nr:hypothetical protein AMSG_08226 [Thecamonas trahens ATCC 50062]KNC51976.1 hypothetical protein AMSG_08226 [Thecamonas trahens ATCC 50062]|eukprot:XP_013755562.1 hypothetical protein AMSG_08226 [Thecamonas trahens ATCC 50062]